jgi:UDP-2,3-diacylglucosamine hydrolase
LTLLSSVQAPPTWRRLAFISDLHLGQDTPNTQAAFQSWLGRLNADALFILGDLFEAWVGDDALELPFAQQLAEALRALGKPIYFQHGNRDFLLRDLAGMALLDEICVLHAFGRKVLLTHGDAQCLQDAAYQATRSLLRQTSWQTEFLALPLVERLRQAAQMRDASRRVQGEMRAMGLPFADPDAATCRAQLRASQCECMVHGHTHRPGRFDLGDGLSRLVLSDWDFEQQPPRGDCLMWSPEGWTREPVWA